MEEKSKNSARERLVEADGVEQALLLDVCELFNDFVHFVLPLIATPVNLH